MATLSQQLGKMNVNAIQTNVVCDHCAGNHSSVDCQVGNPFAQSSYGQTNYVSNFQRQNNPYSNTYNPGWRNHPNFSWSNNQGQAKPPQQFPQQEKKPTLEDMFMQYMQKTDVAIQNHSASIHNLEVQIGQLSSMLTERTAGTLPSNTVTNPKEHVKAISLRSGRTYEEPKVTNAKQDKPVDNEESKMKEVESEMKEMEQAEKTKENERASKYKKSREVTFETYSPSIYDPPIPFPQRLRKNNVDDQFSKFLSIFKQLHINIPLIEALEQMPKYAKFLKDIISKKRKLEEHETVMLTEESSAILQKKLPPKLKDPGSFTIPCTIGQSYFDRALCDLGASINLMPLSVFRKLGLGEVKPTTISLQLADRSIKYPRGVIENVLVKVDKFIFPADFIVLDMDEDEEIPLILGRPFLATGRTLIDVQQGKLVLRVGEDEVTFNVFKSMEFPSETHSCFQISDRDMIMADETCAIDFQKLPLEATPLFPPSMQPKVEDLKSCQPTSPPEEPPKLELKPLPSNLRYAFLGQDSTLPVIINSSLSDVEEEKLLRILREHKMALGWTISDIKGISPSICTHRILMEDNV
ncbi:uncharacterized protein LOC136070386 [Quercus suber]